MHRHPLPLCASQPSWRPSLLVSSPTWREVVSTGPVLCTPSTGNTGACLCPRHVLESGKLGRSASSLCSSSRTRFWHNRSMPSSPTCAWFWQSHDRTSSSMAWTASTSASLSSTTASMHRRPSTVPYAPAASSAATSTSAPDHDIDHGDSSHGYLDQGCSTHRSQLPRHRHKGYHLA
jgi:hypothetical protein